MFDITIWAQFETLISSPFHLTRVWENILVSPQVDVRSLVHILWPCLSLYCVLIDIMRLNIDCWLIFYDLLMEKSLRNHLHPFSVTFVAGHRVNVFTDRALIQLQPQQTWRLNASLSAGLYRRSLAWWRRAKACLCCHGQRFPEMIIGQFS